MAFDLLLCRAVVEKEVYRPLDDLFDEHSVWVKRRGRMRDPVISGGGQMIFSP